MAGSNLVQSIERSIAILNCLSKQPDEIGLSDLASQVGLNPSTTYRILSTLIKHKYVEQDAKSKNYKLGIGAMILGQTPVAKSHLYKEAEVNMSKLARKTGELVNFAILDIDLAMYLIQVQGNRVSTLHMSTVLGTRVPLYCTGVGKAMLAFMTEEQLDRYFSDNLRLQAYTANTITTRLDLLQELGKIRKLGYAIENEERDLGIGSVAAPIHDFSKNVVGAISVSGPSGRILPFTEELGPLLMQTATEISSSMGYISADINQLHR